ncbi:L-lactate dehydrogenase (cytochrome) [Geosmithia morbida]|uniref:L-lactate dehydrogenase (Cytochrome) n=1 Tax=Geosmithia morbida TaxID=1094350 RepID=A0A9P4YSD4_9HYPO|nr:L-lactate dehydrogenase (cytochrome) [Geosmithia morbida]KAF4122241.1 L-lactate dehydrogenase (cytochrome) [Geosmithia morbida]
MTDFLARHPGGANAILAEAGKDVSRLFSMLHAPDALSSLPEEYCVGPVDMTTLPAEEEDLSEEDAARIDARDEMPTADAMLLLSDFEFWAERTLGKAAWAYYRSASDQEATFHENANAYKRYFFRPRILRDMSHGDMETSIVGIPVSMPVVISPAAMAKLGHPLGEVNLTRAAGTAGVVQIISANASCSLEEIFESRTDDHQPLFYQVYLNKDRKQSEQVIQKAERLGAKAIVFTVDVMRQTKRTMDVRAKLEASPPKKNDDGPKQKSVSESISGYQDWNLTWGDIDFIRGITKLPIIVKGVQSVEDVQLCVNHGVEGVILSNHGGRQADYAPAPIDILYELRVHQPHLFSQIDVMVDGGIRSGADVVKALALGAKAVGLGRPFMYANGTHGEEGVSRALESMYLPRFHIDIDYTNRKHCIMY